MKLKLLKDLNEQIHRDNSDDPSNPEISIQGAGVRELKHVVQVVKNRIVELGDLASKATSSREWGQIQAMLTHAATEAQIQAIIDAMRELEDRAGTRDEMRDVPDKPKGW